MDHRISPPVACVPPRETSDRAEVLKKGHPQAVNRPNASTAAVRYGTGSEYRGSTPENHSRGPITVVQGVQGVQGETKVECI